MIRVMPVDTIPDIPVKLPHKQSNYIQKQIKGDGINYWELVEKHMKEDEDASDNNQ